MLYQGIVYVASYDYFAHNFSTYLKCHVIFNLSLFFKWKHRNFPFPKGEIYIGPRFFFSVKWTLSLNQWFSSHGTHKPMMRILQHTKKKFFLLTWPKIRYNFDWFTKNNSSNYLPFLLHSDFLKNQVPILVYKDFWYQEWTNQMQSFYAMWPIRCTSIVWPVLWLSTGHSHWTAIVVLAVVIFLFHNRREKRSVPLTK